MDEAASWCRGAEVASEQVVRWRGQPRPCAPGALLSHGASCAPEDWWAPGAPRTTAAYAPGASRAAASAPEPLPPQPEGGVFAERSNCPKCYHGQVRNQSSAWNVKCFRCMPLRYFTSCCIENYVREVKHVSDEDVNKYEELIFHGVEINCIDNKGWFEVVEVNAVPVTFKLDSGAGACVMSLENYLSAGFNKDWLIGTGTVLREVSRNVLPVLGYFDANFSHKGANRSCKNRIYVIDIKCYNLLSRDTCAELCLLMRLNETHDNHNSDDYARLMTKYSEVFKGSGRLPGVHSLAVDKTVTPVVECYSKIPNKMFPRLREELVRLQQINMIDKVYGPTDWVSSIVLVEKPDGKLGLSIDPKHLNKAIICKRSRFQLPKLDQIAGNLKEAKYFSRLDVSEGFHMIVLDDASSNLCTFATPFGRFKFLRLQSGICSAAEVFHDAMLKIFSMEGVECFVDDLLVYGRSEEEHAARLEAVLRRAAASGVRFTRDKSSLWKC